MPLNKIAATFRPAGPLRTQGLGQRFLGSRNPVVVDQIERDGYFPAVDRANHESIQVAFTEVTKKLEPPSVVIFNAPVLSRAPVGEDPLTLSVESFRQQTEHGVAVFAAAQAALQGFRSEIHQGKLKTFIVTGNPLPWLPPATALAFGMNIHKLIQWRLTEIFAHAYSKENIRFYFATLVGETGGVVDPVSSFLHQWSPACAGIS
ncbi:hypothetical protein C8F04DRAFT_1391277 [Mycena alexandri]|uniref:Uncharacterized protein n=1 Tax=Mycena alexandri TaxID=1745969 RepID=A0AAD6XAS4_9AGAR|nr:hypothetical protein C8F04DRAFT_1391277 [Mycena alexandri]